MKNDGDDLRCREPSCPDFGDPNFGEGTCPVTHVDPPDDLPERLRAGEASDGHHTHNELYEYRMLYNAHAALGWLAAGIPVVKSWRHSDGEPCFGGGWFIVTATLPTGQVSNHYRAEHWDLFQVPEVDLPPEYDGHTPSVAAERLRAALATAEPVGNDGLTDAERREGAARHEARSTSRRTTPEKRQRFVVLSERPKRRNTRVIAWDGDSGKAPDGTRYEINGDQVRGERRIYWAEVWQGGALIEIQAVHQSGWPTRDRAKQDAEAHYRAKQKRA